MKCVLILIIINCSYCIKFFNREYYVSFRPHDRYSGTKNLFGFSVIYSENKKKFYVGAPTATKDENGAITGAVFECEKSSQQCLKYFKIANEQDYTVQNTNRHKPLFGMSLAQINPNVILICSPNIHVKETESYYCNQYFISSTRIVSDYGFLKASQCVYYDEFSNYGLNLVFSQRYLINVILIGSKIYYKSQYDYENNPFNYLVEIDSTRYHRYIPTEGGLVTSYTIVLYPIENPYIYMLVTYYLSSNLLGSFEVKKKPKLVTHQYVEIKDGSPGQYFGFSGTFGHFNKDDCFDFAASAPFYSHYMDEGRVYIFYWDTNANLYNIVPTILSGDRERFSRFGISVVSIGTRFLDGINNIAVLAPYWYHKNPVIYVYSSNGERLNSEYADKIILESDQGSSWLLSYSLLSSFKVSSSNNFDLLIQFPINDTIKVLSSVESFKLKIDTSTKILHEMPTPLNACFGVDGLPECYFTSKYMLKSCVIIQTMNNIDRLTNDVLKLKHSLHGSPGAYISNQQIHKEMEHTSVVINNTCFQNEISFLYTPMSEAPIVVHIEGYIEHRTSTDCNGFCSDSDPVTFYHEIQNPFSQCDSTSCVPNFQIIDISNKDTFRQGVVSNLNLEFKFMNRGSVVSYISKFIIECPIWVDITQISFDKIKADAVVREVQTSDDSNTIIYLINHIINQNEKIKSTVLFEIRAPFGVDFANIHIKIIDPMYKFKEMLEVPITLSGDRKIPLDITFYSVPSTISIGDQPNEEKDSRPIYLEYHIEIENIATSESMEDVVLEIFVTTSVHNVHFLKFASMRLPNDFNEVACNTDGNLDCSKLKFLLQSKYLPPHSTRKFHLLYMIKNSIDKLVKFQVEKLDVKAILCYQTLGRTICKEFNFHTIIENILENNSWTSVWPIILAVIMSCVVLIVITAIMIKSQFLKKFKNIKADSK